MNVNSQQVQIAFDSPVWNSNCHAKKSVSIRRYILAHPATSGWAFLHLYPKVVEACRRDSSLYEILALVDAIRGGRARERAIAAQELTKRMS